MNEQQQQTVIDRVKEDIERISLANIKRSNEDNKPMIPTNVMKEFSRIYKSGFVNLTTTTDQNGRAVEKIPKSVYENYDFSQLSSDKPEQAISQPVSSPTNSPRERPAIPVVNVENEKIKNVMKIFDEVKAKG